MKHGSDATTAPLEQPAGWRVAELSRAHWALRALTQCDNGVFHTSADLRPPWRHAYVSTAQLLRALLALAFGWPTAIHDVHVGWPRPIAAAPPLFSCPDEWTRMLCPFGNSHCSPTLDLTHLRFPPLPAVRNGTYTRGIRPQRRSPQPPVTVHTTRINGSTHSAKARLYFGTTPASALCVSQCPTQSTIPRYTCATSSATSFLIHASAHINLHCTVEQSEGLNLQHIKDIKKCKFFLLIGRRKSFYP